MTSIQGQTANLSGSQFENEVAKRLQNVELEYETQVKFTNIYGSNMAKIDIYVPLINLYIECKNQNVGGSVDEKVPFVVENLKNIVAKDNSAEAMVVFGGTHWKGSRGKKIVNWAKTQCNCEHLNAFYLDEFENFLSHQLG